MCESKIALEKIRAYRATDYRLGHTDKDIVLAVGLRSYPSGSSHQWSVVR